MTSTTSQSTDAPSFRDLGVPKKLNDVLHAEGIRTAFPIQTLAVPPALAGDDICGRAPTGSGKTLAFSIPLVENVRESRPHHPGALVLVPTRELAGQVRDTIMPMAQARRRWVQTFYGGTNVKRDIAALRKGVDIAVCTPGRLEDLVQQGELHLDEVRVVVLDEADRMADMGFLPVVKRMLDKTHPDRQTLLFSATLDGDVDVLVRRYQHDPVRIEVDESEEEQGDVVHHFWDVNRSARKDTTADVLRRSGSTIVFTRTKRGADRLAKQLASTGLTTAAIHGNRSQNQRERALGEFSSGKVTVLVATDVAARGIHVDDVDTVLHYDLPATDKDYVHRSGRTGRAGRDGIVISLVCEDQASDLRDLQKGLDVGRGSTSPDLAAVGAGSSGDGRARRSASNGSGESGSGGGRARSQGDRSRNGQRSGGQRQGQPQGGARSRARRRSNR